MPEVAGADGLTLPAAAELVAELAPGELVGLAAALVLAGPVCPDVVELLVEPAGLLLAAPVLAVA
ncbi:MAG: hypothetical protein ABI140_11995 [Jatrophihabitantaceae bacterium]